MRTDADGHGVTKIDWCRYKERYGGEFLFTNW